MMQRSLSGWGVRARLEASSGGLLRLAFASLPSGFRVSTTVGQGPKFRVGGAGSRFTLDQDDLLRYRGRSKTGLRAALAGALETHASTHSRTFAFLHAGCVEIDGRVILMPGRSYAGKSTLVAAFLKRGAAYFSDDMAPVDRRLRAHPFPRPLGIRSQEYGTPIRTPIEKLGAVAGERARPIALIWCGTYDPLARRPSFRRRPGLKAFAELLGHCPGAQIRPEVIVPILTGLARTVPVFAGVRGDADQMVDALMKRLRR